ncbi:MAG: prepilin peptidase [Elusimicrobia bacterium]|nr:prepilin peptidase [Elusimicrobiota bacterium]
MFERILVFLFGLIMGSFANVCIYRMPKNLSIFKPNFRCMNCNSFIKWYDNIPIISYILLKGKCRSCGSKIAFIYPAMELICGLLFLSMFYLFGFSFALIPFCLLLFSLLVITAIDFKFQIIPDEISFMLMVVGSISCFCNPVLGNTTGQRILNSFLGFFAGGGSLFLVAVIGKLIFKKDVMGGGDIKLMAGVGSFIGCGKVLFAIFIASLLGSIVGMSLIIFKKIIKKQEIAFGPYLALGTYLTLFLPAPHIVINWIMTIEEKILVKLIN